MRVLIGETVINWQPGCHLAHASPASVKELEVKVAELESETDRLSTSLEVQKRTTVDAQTTSARKVEEMNRELQKRASVLSKLRLLRLIDETGPPDGSSQKLTSSGRRSSSTQTTMKSSVSSKS